MWSRASRATTTSSSPTPAAASPRSTTSRTPTKKITYGTTGVGTGAQLACALTFNVNDGADGEAIPFDGGAPALTALLGNQVDTACLQVGEAVENIESGKIVPLTVFGPERVEFLPDVPTAKEQGLDVEVAQYRFMTVPKGTPQDVQDTIAEAMQATFKTEDYKEFNKQNNLTPLEISGDEVVARWRRTRSATPTSSRSTASTSAKPADRTVTDPDARGERP